MKHVSLSVLFFAICISVISCDDKQQSDSPKTLLISFDGFRHDYLSKVETPHFDSLSANGVQSEGLIPVFPSKTFPNHYAMVTGLYPENSGFVGNTMYDPQWDEWYRISDREAVENGKWYGGEPIWNTLEKQGIKTGTMFWVGSEADVQEIHPTYWKKYDGDMPFKARVDTVVKWLSAPDSQAVDFATLYFEHVDAVGHRYGTKSDSLKKALKISDQILGYLKREMRKKKLWKDTNVLIVSDHGMVDLSADKVIALDTKIDTSHVKRIIYGPLTMIQPKEGKAEAIYQGLKNNQKHYRVYKKANLPNRYHLKNNRRVMEVLIIAEPGYTILESAYKPEFAKYVTGATHGYDPSDRSMHALFLARGPAFARGKKVKPFQNIHLYELLNNLMETQPAPNDGSLDSVKVLLK